VPRPQATKRRRARRRRTRRCLQLKLFGIFRPRLSNWRPWRSPLMMLWESRISSRNESPPATWKCTRRGWEDEIHAKMVRGCWRKRACAGRLEMHAKRVRRWNYNTRHSRDGGLHSRAVRIWHHAEIKANSPKADAKRRMVVRTDVRNCKITNGKIIRL
jgi:hypothetical protein